jgi:TRAP-type C4-dicarboxylate transport system substrate-binding protein
VVDGYGWPIQGIFDFGWHEKTKFRVDPGFYNVEVSVLVNLNTWKRLDDKQREFLNKQALWLEELDRETIARNEADRKRQAEVGIQTITFSDAVAKEYLAKAYKVGWDSIIAKSPEHGPKLKELLSK